MRRYLQNLCHFVILEEWIDLIPPQKGDLLEFRNKYAIAYMRARIDRIRSIPKLYQQHLKEATLALKKAQKEGIDCAREQNELNFEKGILLTMQRRYYEALEVFNKDYQETHNLKSLERIIQTSMSLGNLKAAAKRLKELDRRLNQIGEKNASAVIHDWAMYHRHQSTLCTLRLMLYDYKPQGIFIEKASLFSQAKDESERCKDFSTRTGPSPFRHTIQDESGVGIALLKKAQALYASMRFDDSKNAALEGAGILAGYPNSRWWRMCCHDLAARCSALLYDFALAEKHLGYARAAFDDSGKDDYVRDCELKRTEGIIMLRRGKVDEAIELLRQSLDFKTKYHCVSRCIEVFHLMDLANVLIANGQIKEAGKILARARKVSIIW
jgi:tetratricopeptide (TPR) repeat protein